MFFELAIETLFAAICKVSVNHTTNQNDESKTNLNALIRVSLRKLSESWRLSVMGIRKCTEIGRNQLWLTRTICAILNLFWPAVLWLKLAAFCFKSLYIPLASTQHNSQSFYTVGLHRIGSSSIFRNETIWIGNTLVITENKHIVTWSPLNNIERNEWHNY